MSIIGLFLALIVFCLCIWVVRAVLGAFKIEDPVATIVYVAVVIIAVLWLVGQFGGGSLGSLHLR